MREREGGIEENNRVVVFYGFLGDFCFLFFFRWSVGEDRGRNRVLGGGGIWREKRLEFRFS